MNSILIKKSVRAMSGYVPGEQPSEAGVVKLNTNENPYPPSPGVFHAIARFDAARLRLYPDPVSKALRKRIAEIHGCSMENVFAGNGSDEILSLCTRAFVEDTGSIGYFNPSYSLYPVLADIRDVIKKPVELGEDFEWMMPGRYSSSLFFLTNPNAPTSIFYPKLEVKKFCSSFRGVVLIDEAYVDFSSESCMDFAMKYDNVLVMRTLSKSYSLAGLRVGYVVGSRHLIASIYKIKDSYNLDMFSQVVATAALSDLSYMRANVAKIKKTRRRLRTALESLGFRVYPSETNFLWVRPPGMNARRLFEGLKKKRIFVRYFKGKRTGDFVRITVGRDEDVDKLIAVISGLSERKER